MPADRLVWSPSTALCQPLKWSCLWAVDFLWSWFVEEKLDYLTGNLILKPCLVLQTFKMHIFRRLISLSVIITRPCWLLFPTNSQLPFRVRCSFIRFMGKMCPALFMAKKTTLTALNVTFVEGLSSFLSLHILYFGFPPLKLTDCWTPSPHWEFAILLFFMGSLPYHADLAGEELEKPTQYKLSIFNLIREKFCNWFPKRCLLITKRLFKSAFLKTWNWLHDNV